MKQFILFLFFSFLSCNQKITSNANSPQNLVGKWKLYETSGSDGANTFTSKVEEFFVYDFQKNGIFAEEKMNKKSTGTYKIISENLVEIIKEKDSIYYQFRFDNHSLILYPVNKDGAFMRDEGCSETYKKVD